ncbi:hypothetical protein [Streptomyces sp. NPDC093591]|uniref:hypothetical protein n=1 Tax=Streptomyces sp. NPDC093591 TaxID=3366044 RepID=UPI0037F5B667
MDVPAAQGRAGAGVRRAKGVGAAALCPSTTEAGVVREWLPWAPVGMEGVVHKRLDGVYEPSVRGW